MLPAATSAGLPRRCDARPTWPSGSAHLSPCLPCPAQFTGKNTFFGKTASLLQGVDELGNIQKILLQLMIVLVRRRLLAAASLPALACLQPALGTSTTTQHARPARLP